MTTSPNTHAQIIALRIFEKLNKRGTVRVDKYFSRLIANRLLSVIAGNINLIYRTSLHGQPLWNTSNDI